MRKAFQSTSKKQRVSPISGESVAPSADARILTLLKTSMISFAMRSSFVTRSFSCGKTLHSNRNSVRAENEGILIHSFIHSSLLPVQSRILERHVARQ